MKINELNASFNYANSSPMTAKSTVKTSSFAPNQNQDGFKISSEAQALLNNKQAALDTGQKYDLNTIMQLHKKENKTEIELALYYEIRKNNPKLDQALYDMDKAEALEFVSKVQNILLKSLIKQALTPEEKKIVEEDVLLQQEIERRKSLF